MVVASLSGLAPDGEDAGRLKLRWEVDEAEGDDLGWKNPKMDFWVLFMFCVLGVDRLRTREGAGVVWADDPILTRN